MNCEVCNAKVTELRRGRCWGCYNRWVDARPVGLGAHCTVCVERRRDLLRSIELLGAWMPMCYSCSGRAMQLDPLPRTLGEIRDALSRNRRGPDRRWGKRDTRVFQHDRRNDDRRNSREGDWMSIDEGMILEIDELVESIERERDADAEGGDLTRIRELPTR